MPCDSIAIPNINHNSRYLYYAQLAIASALVFLGYLYHSAVHPSYDIRRVVSPALLSYFSIDIFPHPAVVTVPGDHDNSRRILASG